jgi:hypothetical protein
MPHLLYPHQLLRWLELEYVGEALTLQRPVLLAQGRPRPISTDSARTVSRVALEFDAQHATVLNLVAYGPRGDQVQSTRPVAVDFNTCPDLAPMFSLPPAELA